MSIWFNKWRADHVYRAERSSSSQSRILHVALTLGALSAVLSGLIMVWLTVSPQYPEKDSDSAPATKSPGLPWSVSGTGAVSEYLPRFRFPDSRHQPADRNFDWRVLGSATRTDDADPLISGFLKHRILHFTFDDGPSLETTSRILDTLSAYNVHATFFVIGKQLYGSDAEAHRDLLIRMKREGHTIALHSYTHNDLRYLSNPQIHRELYRTQRLIQATLGYSPSLFRPPYGGHDKRTDALLRSHGYTEVFWNIAPEEYGAKTPWEIVSNFHAALSSQERNNRGPGGIVLLHDVRIETADAVPLLMEELRRRNCLLLAQDGEELWDVVGDLSYFLLHRDGLPERLVEQRQARAREAAVGYCTNLHAAEAPVRPEEASKADSG